MRSDFSLNTLHCFVYFQVNNNGTVFVFFWIMLKTSIYLLSDLLVVLYAFLQIIFDPKLLLLLLHITTDYAN